ncbi:hypothetical protein [Agrococcus sp. TF02-05]|uniref:alginate O-acetyltransferase AlgX-related protein n=1 Tax=Agrococcus sp. TF02-05 TaxID=2815211 RepID=UPI001AA191B8|nr:hypothetical protein [Agrococcus sp. TF02-05]MBO1770698.1 hypothetical protein [Agrococcus sp. TF02-05]
MTAVGPESLRETPESKPSWRRSHRWRLVPFALLIVAVIAATIAGLVWRSQQNPLGEGVIQPTAEPAAPLDAAACAPAFDGPADDPWADDPAAARAAWDAQAEGLGGYFVEGDDGHVLLGEPHWSNLSQAVGREQLTPAHVEAWDGYLSNMRADLEAQGRELFVMVAPAKWEIVPEALPDGLEELRGPGHFEQLQRELPHVPWVDARAALAEAQRETPLYSRLNSHWSDYGASVAFGQLAECLGATDPALATMPPLPIDGATMAPDRNEFTVAGLTREPGLDWAVPSWTEPAAPMTIVAPDGTERIEDARTALLMSDLPASTSTPAAPVDRHVLLVRDSTGDQLAPMLQSQFQRTTQIRASLEEPSGMPDVPAEAASADADIVVLLLAQRYLQIVPGVERP